MNNQIPCKCLHLEDMHRSSFKGILCLECLRGKIRGWYHKYTPDNLEYLERKYERLSV